MSENTVIRDDCSDDLLTDFLDESTQLIERINERLMELEQWVQDETGSGVTIDEALLNDMFRSAHSIKGLSAMLGLPRINGLTHNIENVFDAARRGQLLIERHVVGVIYASVDRLSELIDHLRDTQSDDLDCEPQIAAIAEVLIAGEALKEQGAQSDVDDAFGGPKPSAEAETKPLTEEETIMEPAIDSAETLPLVDPYDCTAMFAEVHDEAEIPAKYLAIFLDETELSLDEITDLLLDSDASLLFESVRTLMCTSHRIKGSAASIGLNRPAKLAHMMEDVLQRHRDAEKSLDPFLVDALLGCSDALRAYLKGLRSGETVEVDFAACASELLAVEADCLSVSDAAEKPRVAEETTSVQPRTLDPERLQQLAANHFDDDAARLLVLNVKLASHVPLVGLKAQLLCEKLARQGAVLLTDPERSKLETIGELSGIVIGVVTSLADPALYSLLNVSGVQDVNISEIQRDLSVTPKTVEAKQEELPAAPPQVESKEKVVEPPVVKPEVVPPKASETNVPAAKPAAATSGKPADANHAKPAETLRVDIERLDQLMNLAGQLVISKARFNQLGENLRDAVPHKQCQQWLDSTELMCQKMLERSGGIKSKKESKEWSEVHVQVRKIQQNLAAITKEMRRMDSIRTGMTSFFDAVHQLDRVTDGIQKTIMDTRMVPIGPLFGRFRRVVRDISRTNGKEITLEINGEKTELDKRMIDELGDPLIHMVRNSADHGVESPEDRAAAGKPQCGTITLNAFHRGNSIVIQVIDDGRGLSREKIAMKAIEKGLVTQHDLDRMTDQQIYQLIWEPGFSTAESITEISGRGMGMDIVRAKIESINGVVEVDSKHGEGTVFTIKLPLTMAILPSLMARIDDDLFSIPVESIVEIVCLRRDELRTVHGKETAMVRGRPVSIVELHNTFRWSHATQRSTSHGDVTMIIIRNDSREMGLVVDGILGEEDVVVKSLAENYQNVEGIAGACVLGNGRVALILDPAAVIDLAVRSQVETTVC
ncbi:Chemotaxis protein CheA [Bremerella volcania]|uniref:Chemotaxis protein CheA n=1 Tax=Bremerella volcania TaxID=2527984 RepID=A0A518C7D0_9BACT|nr:chemotaxis protein CheA [Bremerella volcania]QDU75131.1 Chemotaxis protein CheA [Bremerella volcania]